MGRITTLVAVLVVVGLAQALPNKPYDPNRTRLIQLLKKALGDGSGNGPFGDSGSGPYPGESGSGPYTGESGSGPYTGESGSGPYTGESGSGPYIGKYGSGPYTGVSGNGPYTGEYGSGPYTGESGSGPYTGEYGSGPYSGGPGVPAPPCDEPTITEMDLEHLEYYFTLPFSNFMEDTVITEMMFADIPQVSHLRDTVLFNPNFAHTLETFFNQVNHLPMNPQTFATAMTMETFPMLMNGRMRCPSTVLNMFFMRLWLNEGYTKILYNSRAYDAFKNAATAVFPPFTNMPNELDRFVQAALEEMKGDVFNDTAKMTLALELRDVAVATHQLYNNFYNMKSGMAAMPVTNMMTIFNNSVMEAGVRCHTQSELFGQHNFVTRMFMNDWEDMEIEDLCYHVGSFFYEFIAREARNMPNMDISNPDEMFQWEQLHPLCTWIQHFVHSEVFPTMARYRDSIQQQDVTQTLAMFNFLGNEEIRTLEELLVRLGWPRPGTAPSTTTFNDVRKKSRNPFRSRRWWK